MLAKYSINHIRTGTSKDVLDVCDTVGACSIQRDSINENNKFNEYFSHYENSRVPVGFLYVADILFYDCIASHGCFTWILSLLMSSD